MEQRNNIDLRANDVFADILGSIRVRGTVYRRPELTAPWGLAVGARDSAGIHVLIKGKCWLEVNGQGSPIPLDEGDVVIFPKDLSHTVRNDPETQASELVKVISQAPPNSHILRFGGDGDLTVLICGGLWLEEKKTNLLLSSLPPFIRVNSNQKGCEALKAVVQSIELEIGTDLPGTQTIINRLTETLILHMIRRYFIEARDSDAPFFRALRDSQIVTALSLIHSRPEKNWTIEALARDVRYVAFGL